MIKISSPKLTFENLSAEQAEELANWVEDQGKQTSTVNEGNNIMNKNDVLNKGLKIALASVGTFAGVLLILQLAMLVISNTLSASFGAATQIPYLVSSILSPIMFIVLYFLFLHKIFRTKLVIVSVVLWLVVSVGRGYFDYGARSKINSAAYFDPTNGDPLKRYCVDTTGRIHLFPSNIKIHPEFGIKLKPVTYYVIMEYNKRMSEDNNAAREKIRLRKEKAARQIKLAQEANTRRIQIEKDKLILEEKIRNHISKVKSQEFELKTRELKLKSQTYQRDLAEKRKIAAAGKLADELEAAVKGAQTKLAEKRKLVGSISRVKLWNQHNGNSRNCGTKNINLKLYLGGQLVRSYSNYRMRYSLTKPVHDSFNVSGLWFDELKIEILSWYGAAGGLSEVEILTDSGVNIANKCLISASAPHVGWSPRGGEDYSTVDKRTPDKLVDGKMEHSTSHSQLDASICLLPVHKRGWFRFKLTVR